LKEREREKKKEEEKEPSSTNPSSCVTKRRRGRTPQRITFFPEQREGKKYKKKRKEKRDEDGAFSVHFLPRCLSASEEKEGRRKKQVLYRED